MWDFSFQARYKASITGVSVKGLKVCKTLKKDPDPTNPIEGREERDVITFPGFVDCIYLDSPDAVHLDKLVRCRFMEPTSQTEACFKDFVCVENAKIGTVQLEPNQYWIAKQHLTIG